MKKLALHVTAISLLLAGAASAADLRRPMPVKAPAPAPIAAYNWTGCYVGAGGGYGMFRRETRAVEDSGFSTLSTDNGGDGWFGTVQVGCDYQIGSNIVIGAFADYDFGGNIRGDMSVPDFLVVGREKLKHSWAAGGRIGWLPFQERFLVFVSGGYTQAKFGGADFLSADSGLPTGLAVLSHKPSGWFIGTGYEYGLTWFPIQGLFWKTEYRFADYGSDTRRIFDGGFPTTVSIDQDTRVHTVRSELVWRFNFGGYGAPVAARY
jgi:outer membrane immunogenic protein